MRESQVQKLKDIQKLDQFKMKRLEDNEMTLMQSDVQESKYGLIRSATMFMLNFLVLMLIYELMITSLQMMPVVQIVLITAL